MEQPTLTSVAQTVVDKVVRLHHDNFLTKRRNVTTRDDITLIIRNFNFQLRGALTPGAVGPLPGSISPRLPPRPMMPIPLPQVTTRQIQVLPIVENLVAVQPQILTPLRKTVLYEAESLLEMLSLSEEAI